MRIMLGMAGRYTALVGCGFRYFREITVLLAIQELRMRAVIILRIYSIPIRSASTATAALREHHEHTAHLSGRRLREVVALDLPDAPLLFVQPLKTAHDVSARGN